MLEFSWPWVFLLLPLPWVYYRFLTPSENMKAAIKVPFVHRDSLASSSTVLEQSRRTPLILCGLAWITLLVGAAHPTVVGDAVELPRSGRDLMLAVDISRSMNQPDMIFEQRRYSRIVVVKSILKDFLEKRVGDRVGLILFGSQAYLQAPLTFDINTVAQFLDEADIGLAGSETAIGDAIGLAIKRLQDRPESQRILILLTDGKNSRGIDPLDTVPAAQLAKVKIYTIGVSSRSRNIDEQSLQLIAQKTGGQYYLAQNPQQLVQIYKNLDQIEAIDQDGEFFRPRKSYFYYPLLASFALVLITLGLRILRSRGAME